MHSRSINLRSVQIGETQDEADLAIHCCGYCLCPRAYALLLSVYRLREYLGMMPMDIKPHIILVRLRSVRCAYYGAELDFNLIDLDQTHRVDPEDVKEDPDDKKDDCVSGYGSVR